VNPGFDGPVRLVQVSDCHVSSVPGTLYRGFDPFSGLKGLLPQIRAFGPDALVLTGDISEDGSTASYCRVHELLRELDIPLLALPGNHDEPEEMRRHFSSGPWGGPYFERIGDWLIALLDSTIPGGISGELDEAEMDALAAGLADSNARYVLFALHHQPMAMGSRWIDRYALQDGDSFQRFVQDEGRSRGVAWGHVHQAFERKTGDVLWLGAPSTAVNSEPGRERFTPDAAGPACRWLVLQPDGGIGTGLLREEAA